MVTNKSFSILVAQFFFSGFQWKLFSGFQWPLSIVLGLSGFATEISGIFNWPLLRKKYGCSDISVATK